MNRSFKKMLASRGILLETDDCRAVKVRLGEAEDLASLLDLQDCGFSEPPSDDSGFARSFNVGRPRARRIDSGKQQAHPLSFRCKNISLDIFSTAAGCLSVESDSSTAETLFPIHFSSDIRAVELDKIFQFLAFQCQPKTVSIESIIACEA